MVKTITLLDCIHLQKYTYLISLFISNKVETSVFEQIFLQIRREDTYWMAGMFNEAISKLLDTFFLDIDEYVPTPLFSPEDKFSIDEKELRERAVILNNKLAKITNSYFSNE
jgi:hypothetical protein